MSEFAGAYISEIRVLCDPTNPSGTHKVVLPVTSVEAVFDTQTGQSLTEVLRQLVSSDTEVIDNLTSSSAVAALSANQGRVLKLMVNSLDEKLNSLTGFNITGAVDRFADLPDPLGLPSGTIYLVRTDETRGNVTAIYEVNSSQAWVFLAEFTINLEGYVTTVMLDIAIQNVLSTLEQVVLTRAPASTALSTAQWTNARAALLDRLDATISSRAAASTALSAAVWTNARAALLDRLANFPASGGVGINVSVQRGVGSFPISHTNGMQVAYSQRASISIGTIVPSRSLVIVTGPQTPISGLAGMRESDGVPVGVVSLQAQTLTVSIGEGRFQHPDSVFFSWVLPKFSWEIITFT
ncbi:MAG: hypothetical protein FWD98_02595 [Defluviitaleaceae bacterium]|nr:hypothetical protein [Defluviitaleaceae bacterium]